MAFEKKNTFPRYLYPTSDISDLARVAHRCFLLFETKRDIATSARALLCCAPPFVRGPLCLGATTRGGATGQLPPLEIFKNALQAPKTFLVVG